MSSININLDELRGDIKTFLRESLSFITSCISGLSGLNLPSSKNYSDEVSEIKELLRGLKTSINESVTVIGDLTKFFNSVETKNQRTLNYLSKKYNIKQLDTEQKDVDVKIEENEQVENDSDQIKVEVTEKAQNEKLVESINNVENVESNVDKNIYNSDLNSNADFSSINEVVAVEVATGAVVSESIMTQVSTNNIEDVHKVNRNFETKNFTKHNPFSSKYAENIIMVDVVNSETQAVESESFVSTIKENLIRILKILSTKWKQLYTSIEENINNLRNKNNYKGLFSEEQLMKESKYLIDNQTKEVKMDFYNNTFPELQKKLVELGYVGDLSASNPEEALALLEELSKKLNKKISKYQNVSDGLKTLTGVTVSDFDAELEKFQKQYAVVEEALSYYKMNVETIEFNVVYAKYEEKILDEFSQTYKMDDVITFEESELVEFSKQLFKESDSKLSYDEWYAHEYVNIFNVYCETKYEEAFLKWKNEKYFSKENLIDERALQFLSDSEIGTYNYVYLNYGEAAALDYLDFMNQELNKREGKAEAEAFLATLEGCASDYFSTAAEGFGDGIVQFGNGIANWVVGDEDLDVNDYKTMYLLQEISKDGSKYKYFLDDVYNVSTSIGNMAIPSLIGVASSLVAGPLGIELGAGFSSLTTVGKVLKVASYAGSATLGISAGGNAFDQALESGNSTLNSLTYGFLSGSSEVLTERFLGGIPGLSSQTKGFISSMGSEAIEEFVQSYIDVTLRCAVLDDKITDIDFGDTWNEAAKSAIYGGLTGGIMSGANIVLNGVVYTAADCKFLLNQSNPQDYIKALTKSQFGGKKFDEVLSQQNPTLYKAYIEFKNNSNSNEEIIINNTNSVEKSVEKPNIANQHNIDNIDTSDAGIKKVTEVFNPNDEYVEENVDVPNFSSAPTIDISSSTSVPSNNDIYNPTEIERGWIELMESAGETIINTASESFNDNVILPLTEMFEKTKNIFEIKQQEEQNDISVPNFSPAPTIDIISNTSVPHSNEIYNLEEIQNGWNKILDNLKLEKQVSSNTFQTNVIDPLIKLVEETKNIFVVDNNSYEESPISIPVFEKMPNLDIVAGTLALGNIVDVVEALKSKPNSLFDSSNYDDFIFSPDLYEDIIPGEKGKLSELVAEKEIFDEIEGILDTEEVNDAEFYEYLEQRDAEIKAELEQQRLDAEEAREQKIFEEINDILDADETYKPSYNALSSDLIKQMLKTRIKGILSNNNLSVKTRVEDAISIFKSFRKIYTKGSFNNETGKTLESLFFDPNIAIGIHRAGLTDGQVIVDEGLKLSGDMSSGRFDIDQTRLSKNISFFSQNNLISYLGFLNSINTAHNYKTYGVDNADVVLFAFPKDAIIDYEDANLSKYPDLVIQNENGQYIVNPKYILGYVNDNNGVVSDIKLNKNYTGDSSGDIYITPRSNIFEESLLDENIYIENDVKAQDLDSVNEVQSDNEQINISLSSQEKFESFLKDVDEMWKHADDKLNGKIETPIPDVTKKELLKLNYDSLKSHLLRISEDDCKEILANDEIKHKLIDTLKRHDFIWLAQEDNNYIIPSLLEGNGLNILANTTEVVDKLNGIITCGQEYVAELFKNREFITLVLNHFQSLNYLSQITSEGAYNFVQELINMKTDIKLLTKIICLVNKDAQIKVVENLNLPDEIFWDLVINMNPEASDILMKNNSVGKHLNDFNLVRLDALFKQQIFLPSDIIEDKNFMKSFTTMLDIKAFRILMNNLEKANDVSLIEQKRKSFYEKMINSYDEESNMLSIFNELNLSLKNALNTSTVNLGFVYNNLINVIPNKLDSEYLYKLDSLINEKNNVNSESILSFFQKLSNLELTNMIIDYHFEDVYFNVLKDIEILCKFYESGGLSLSEEDYQLYSSILHLDELSYSEKLKLHEKMKSYDFKEKFYDDVRNAKNISYQMINESILNAEKVKKYKNEELSNKYGVDIYVLDGDPFKVLVKSFGSKDKPLERINNFHITSLSLDGSDKLNTFRDPRDDYNIVYDSLREDQVIHTFPVDSFTSRPNKYDNNFTDRFNEFLTPDELVNKSPDYNELLIMSGSEYDEKITPPEMIALYCYDEITENDIESAKNLGIGIVLVMTKKYEKKVSDNQIRMNDTTGIRGDEILDYNYLTRMDQNAMYGRNME